MTSLGLHVSTPQGYAGLLDRAADGAYGFTYDLKAHAEVAVSLTMPVRPRTYLHEGLHPIFQMNLPEGFLRERLRAMLSKTSGSDPMLLLALLGGDASIGRLRFHAASEAFTEAPKSSGGGERLGDLLSYKGAQGLFESLLDRYLMRGGLSGIQPKVLVPELPVTKAAMATTDFIVKSGLQEFPGLAINEFVCMRIVARCGVPVPEIHLSDDRSLLVMRRFDRTADGQALGFEDMAVMSAKGAEQKYEGSYEQVAKLVAAFASPLHMQASLRQLYDMVALSCMLGNGDAHLKNFGLLYEDDENVRLAPAFDIVNTTCYLPQDNLALSLAGNRSLFASRQGLLDFAPRCNVSHSAARRRLLEMTEVAREVMREHADLIGEVAGLGEALEMGVTQFEQSFRPAASP